MQNYRNGVPEKNLPQYAQQAFEKLLARKPPRAEIGARGVARLCARSLRQIEGVTARCAAWAHTRTTIPQEFEWLLDNRYLASREGNDAARTIRRAGKLSCAEVDAKESPASCRGGRADGNSAEPARFRRIPVVYELARGLIRAGQGIVTAERIALFLEGAQKVRSLTEQELWLFTPMLRAALVEQMAALCGDILSILTGYGGDPLHDPFAAELLVQKARMEGAPPPPAAEALMKGAEGVHQRLGLLMGNAVTSLRQLNSLDLTDVLKAASAVERILLCDPAGVYARMDERSQAWYRREVVLLAKRRGIREDGVAARALELAEAHRDASSAAGPEGRDHVGYYLVRRPLGEEKKAAGRWYFAAMAALIVLLAGVAAALTRQIPAVLLLLLPAWDIAKNVADFLAVHLTSPGHIPRLELPGGLPEEAKTLVVISALLTDSKKGPGYAERLREYRACNRDAGDNLLFGLLCDLPDAPHKNRAGDKRVIEEAQKAVFALNRAYGGGFYLFFRERELHMRDGVFMGWERKRGALLELVRLVLGKPSGLRAVTGDPAALRGIRYIITLDADTRLTAGSARELAAAMLHPLCRPVVDPERRIVTGGYGLLQPRTAIELEAACKSFFSRVFAGQGGLDPYGGGASDVYQDLFDRGSFVGKGIFDVAAFHACLDGRFPENRILSHDLLEGEYLRSGLIGDVELTDGYPHKVTAWFDRLHRWTRGDWQIASWMLPWVKTAGDREKNPLSPLSRYKIFDNLRRSLTPAFLLAGLTTGLLLHTGAGWTALVFCLLSMSSALLLSAGELAARGELGRRARTHSTVVSGPKAVLWQTLLQFQFLPHHALVCLHAAAMACYRLLVSRKRLLQWVTAAETERISAGVAMSARRMFPAVAAGALTACLSMTPLGWAVGLAWLLAPVTAGRVSAVRRREISLPEADRAFLSRQAALMWQYFEDFLTPDDHFLPPDNWQEQPAAGLAHRTSPTNIGLTLLCALAAVDLHLTAPERALMLIDRILHTVERLPKWNGHIYNWYDTQTLAPLRPRCVSTVDSGNLAGCLIALAEGLTELRGEQAEGLAARARKLAEDIRFEPLYDKKRRFFAIGYDLEADKLTDGFYDLLASEARQTSYIAVARGEVERKHWRRLGRSLSGQGGYRGMVSWTGTMFEYMMPHLLMPFYENSLLYESARFALCCQMKLGAEHRVPWGISESCFYAFDLGLSYQYKAHGAPRLAFKRGLGRELVVSPYSAFLALPLLPRAATKNLRRLRDMGLEGRYGLFEAIDFTPARLAGGGASGREGTWPDAARRGEVVRCFMSHHIGMSLLAIDNTLRGNIMQRRFMRDVRMRAFAELLQEKVPLGAGLIRSAGREVPEKPVRASGEGLRRSFSGFTPHKPRCHLLGNASYALMVTDTGLSSSRCSGLTMTRSSRIPREGPGGMRMFLYAEKTLTSLTPAPAFSDEPRYAAEFDSACARWRMESGRIRTELAVFVPENENAEQRAVKITHDGSRICRMELVVYFEPVLMPEADFEAHPSFAKLFLETGLVENILLVRRRPRTGKNMAHLAFACDHAGVTYDTAREKALGRGGMSNLEGALSSPPQNTLGTVLDPCVLARVPLQLEPGQETIVRFALAYAGEGQDAAAAAVRTLKLAPPTAGSGRTDGAIRLLGLSHKEAAQALDSLGALLFPLPAALATAPAASEEGAQVTARSAALRLGQRDLWKFGVSGDLPMTTLLAVDLERGDLLARAVRKHRFLDLCGVSSDLVVLTRDGGDYRRPARGHVMETLKAIGCENRLGARGGVHVIDLSSVSPEEETLLLASAQVLTDLGRENSSEASVAPPQEEGRARGTGRRLPICPAPPSGRSVATGYASDGAFVFDVDGQLPSLAWSHVLSNRSFGALMRETGPVTLWRGNARENKLTPWDNDPLAVDGAETLTISARGLEFSPFARQDGYYCGVTYGFGYAVWEKRVAGLTVKTTAFVPAYRNARVLIVELEGAGRAELLWQLRPQMGAGGAERFFVSASREEGFLRLQNHHNTAFDPQSFLLGASGLSDPSACFVDGEVTMTIQAEPGEQALRAVLVAGCAQNEPGAALLRALADAGTALDMLEETKRWWAGRVRPVNVCTRDTALDNYLNGWALYQVLCCRVFGRASLYQCGGAYGFRDQLQDSCALLYVDPALTRGQILRACRHQYEEGDVQHWWHPGRPERGHSERGVRTRCSDDLLWLPYAVCEYWEKTGDESLLDVAVPYISSEPLAPDAEDRFESPRVGDQRDSVYGHCMRALDCALLRGVGVHGLPLIGTGDWNDGFNLLGAEGKGESVWLAWFLAEVLTRVAPLCEKRGDEARAGYFRMWSEKLVAAAEASWDGAWYRRGYYDDGATLGSAQDEECRIDSLPQSYAALFAGTGGMPEADGERRLTALRSALRNLVDEKAGVVRLFDPAFAQSKANPGYIKGYIAGVRENGGQYTHAAVWLARGCFRAGLREEGAEILRILLPENHPPAVYQAEPFVLAADVYHNPQNLGRGGWSWYTGAAAWYYRVAMEELLGVRLRAGALSVPAPHGAARVTEGTKPSHFGLPFQTEI